MGFGANGMDGPVMPIFVQFAMTHCSSSHSVRSHQKVGRETLIRRDSRRQASIEFIEHDATSSNSSVRWVPSVSGKGAVVSLFVSLLFSSIGGVYLIVGKRLQASEYIVCGAILLIASYLINGALLLTIVGAAVTMVPYAMKRGWF
ncbi:MAG TPA: hypothetical protein VF215_12150 [Thermoanaerobaculia bacterium]